MLVLTAGLPAAPAAVLTPCAMLPGLVAMWAAPFYRRRREAIVVASKLMLALFYPLYRLAWHRPGTPADVRAALGGGWADLPLHPLALPQCGLVVLLHASLTHALRFKVQLLCQLVLLFSVLQSEAVSAAACPL